MPRPERTSSPSWTSPIVPLFHVDFSTTMPSIGETTRILFGVALGVLPRVHRAIALNLERADVGGVGLPPQVERAPKLRRLGAGFVERQPVLLGGDRRHDLGLEDLELRALDGVLGRLELRLAVRAGGDLLAALLVDLLDEIAVLGLTIVRRLDLGLAIELDQQIAALDARARLDQADDHQGAGAGAGARSAQAGNDDRMASNRLDRAVQAQRDAVAGRRRRQSRDHGAQRQNHDAGANARACWNHRRRPGGNGW